MATCGWSTERTRETIAAFLTEIGADGHRLIVQRFENKFIALVRGISEMSSLKGSVKARQIVCGEGANEDEAVHELMVRLLMPLWVKKMEPAARIFDDKNTPYHEGALTLIVSSYGADPTRPTYFLPSHERRILVVEG